VETIFEANTEVKRHRCTNGVLNIIPVKVLAAACKPSNDQLGSKIGFPNLKVKSGEYKRNNSRSTIAVGIG